MMAPIRVQRNEVGGQSFPDSLAAARVELWATVLCLNFAVAGMFAIAATALGWGGTDACWTWWLMLAALLPLLTGRRLC
jgi:hypothetical protein